jgi:ABC-type polysaccharide/polyol phosphate transport system ATPase subunit
MSDIVIKAENISKLYKLGNVSAATFKEDAYKLWAKVRGKEDPTLLLAEVNDRTKKGTSDYVWALKDIHFEVNQGDVLGIIGRNGAGKSTLLKILSKVTAPTTGSIKVKGRIASLLEVGTGFHPELTGKENVYLNGHILGMTKKEIDLKFDEIVDFAGVEKYLDTPVKRYSSGMYVRLAFAVAAHLEPEILVVDEVLAVGDSEFQKKCLGKMNDVSKNEGRTILFVSHNMAAVKELCPTAMFIDKGHVSSTGPTYDVLREYLSAPTSISSAADLLQDYKTRRGYGEVRFSEVIINGGASSCDPSQDVRVHFSGIVLKDVPSILFSFAVFGSTDHLPITGINLFPVFDNPVKAGIKFSFELVIPRDTFRTGFFPLYLWLGKKGELAAENYHYDCIDRLFYINYESKKTKEELGYNPIQPNGFFNINFKIENALIIT